MLSRIEKIQFCLSGFILVLILTLCLGPGVPDGTYLSGIKEVSSQEITVTPGADSRPSPSNMVRPRVSTQDRQLLEKINKVLAKNSLRQRSRFQKKSLLVPTEDFEVIRKSGNWLPQLKKAGHSLHFDSDGRPTMLELQNIEADSYFEKFGFQDGDRMLLIDGGLSEFDASQYHSHWQKAEGILERLQSGGSFSTTILRNGRPIHMEFKLDN